MVKVKDSIKLVRDTFQITEEQQKRLKELSRQTGTSKSAFVRDSLDQYFEKRDENVLIRREQK
jgi:predicted DNA-binding protein